MRSFPSFSILALSPTSANGVAVPSVTALEPYVAGETDASAYTRASAIGAGVVYGSSYGLAYSAYLAVRYTCDPTYEVSGASVGGSSVSHTAVGPDGDGVRLGAFQAGSTVSVRLSFTDKATRTSTLVASASATALVVATSGAIVSPAYGAYSIVKNGESVVPVQLTPPPRAGADLAFWDGPGTLSSTTPGLASLVVRGSTLRRNSLKESA